MNWPKEKAAEEKLDEILQQQAIQLDSIGSLKTQLEELKLAASAQSERLHKLEKMLHEKTKEAK